MYLKGKLKRLLLAFPPAARRIRELDALRYENRDFRRDIESLQGDVKTLSLRSQELSAEVEGLQSANHRASDEINRLHGELAVAYEHKNALWVRPGHYFSPIPAIQDLKSNEKEIFDVPEAICGVNLNPAEQLELLKTFLGFYRDQPFSENKVAGRRYFFENPSYSYMDAIILYCMMRYLKPRRIVEVGSGYSSCAMLDVNEVFFNNTISLTCVDPFPQLLHSLIKDSDRQRTRILGQQVQEVEPAVFRQLEASDILFIDSSHVTKTGGDVNHIFFKILPLLAKGVVVHFHDIFYPFEYPRDWVFEGRAWNEAYLLRAFLQYNTSFKVRFFTTYLFHTHREIFESQMPLCLKNTGGNFWLEKVVGDA